MTTPHAACLVRRDGEVLVEEHVEDGSRVYRLPGRAVPDDADPEAAVRREFEERLGVTLADLTEVGTFDGTRVFEGDVRESWLYDERGFTVYDPESGAAGRVCWLHVDDFHEYEETLRPAGLLDEL